jgi:uncharacterized protein YraI
MKMQSKLIASALTALLAALGTAYAAENSGGGNPTSTPTWTVPVTQPSDITIKQKSSNVKGGTDPIAREACYPPYQWMNGHCLLPRKWGEILNSTQRTSGSTKPESSAGKPNPTSVGAVVPKCPMDEIWVQGPGDPHGHCERKPIPKD